MMDQSLVVGDIVFASHRNRGLYLGTSVKDRPHWLRENTGKWRPIKDVPQEERETNVGVVPAGPDPVTFGSTATMNATLGFPQETARLRTRRHRHRLR
jgi:hypothetical protein